MKRISILILAVIFLSGCTAADPAFVTSELAEDSEVIIRGRTGEDTYQVPMIDVTSGAIETVDFAHHKIHEGAAFTVMEVTDLGNMAIWDILVRTPDTTEWTHLVWEVEHELETLMQIYRDTIVTANGTAITSFNRNGNSTNTATTLVFHTPTITNVGTLIGNIQQGDGKKAGGSDREANEFILKQNTVYLIRISNLTVNNNLISMRLNWYEHENREP